MSRLPRLDGPGTWHHVMNRGIAKRTLFEGRADIRYFLSRLALAVRAGKLEIHAFCVMTTHFHLLVRSPAGDLSQAMRQVQVDYVRRFNRSRRRDGPLLRGRFRSKPVRSLLYRRILVRYIDENPVRAGLCRSGAEYAFGSAIHHSRSSGPRWLERSWVEEEVRCATGRDRILPGDYAKAFARPGEPDVRLVERRIKASSISEPIDDLLGRSTADTLAWMRWKARLADGSEPGLPVADAICIDSAVRAARHAGVGFLLQRSRADLLEEIHAGLLRDLSGAGLAEIAQRTGRGTSSASQLCRRYATRIHQDESYAQHAGRIARAALDLQYGSVPAAPRR